MEGKKVSGKGGEISKVIFNLMLSQKNQITVLKNFSVIPRLKTGGEEAWFNFRDWTKIEITFKNSPPLYNSRNAE